ncbi:hypothetical protein ATANTOWER_006331 [Ataeniobius toweri]|uniref:Uncharacterized protein n=1 Tax=Ataeniobius toweri TaxID=208326 RepID=A0ABU7CFY6_9TELE|nr:hypothetical protein [Ataeniobius toweri]
MEKGEQETEGARGGGMWHLSGSSVGGGFSAAPLLPGRGSRTEWQSLKLSRHRDTSLSVVARQPRTGLRQRKVS